MRKEFKNKNGETIIIEKINGKWHKVTEEKNLWDSLNQDEKKIIRFMIKNGAPDNNHNYTVDTLIKSMYTYYRDSNEFKELKMSQKNIHIIMVSLNKKGIISIQNNTRRNSTYSLYGAGKYSYSLTHNFFKTFPGDTKISKI
jgi:hypothetical protein